MVRPNPPERDVALTVDEACDVLKIRRTKFYELKKNGRLPYFRQGSRILLWRSDCERFLRSLPVVKGNECA
jgi:excisionase family DNA binding protein